jgi:hypothetical protein
MDKTALKSMMHKDLTEKEAVELLKARGFITEICS